jgi:hypothetical protein
MDSRGWSEAEPPDWCSPDKEPWKGDLFYLQCLSPFQGSLLS